MAVFRDALAFVLPHEGGYANNPNDRGGATNYGITQGTLDAWNADWEGYPAGVKDLTVDQAADIYEAQYWPGLEGVTNQAVAAKILDLRVNFGQAGGNRIAQLAANLLVDPPTAVDGNWGPDTLETVNAADPAALLKALADQAEARYQSIVAKNPSQGEFLNGWLKRARDLPVMTIVAGASGLVVLLAIGAFIWISGSKGRA